MPDPRAKPVAALTLDLDDRWAYLRSGGDDAWRTYPSFLPTAIPRIVGLLAELGLRATVFVVGRDAAAAANRPLLDTLATAGHEFASHSFDHHPAFHRLDEAALARDFDQAEAALRPWAASARGFRAPSFGLSRAVIATLVARGYAWDSSVLPCSTGPLAAAWERFHFRRSAEASAERAGAFGGFGMARMPLTPFTWRDDATALVEYPVATMPGTRLPVHWTYLNFIADRSPRLARAYLSAFVALARRSALEPVLLLHATDFLGADDTDAPHFLPGMRRTANEKRAFLRATLASVVQCFTPLPLGELVRRAPPPASVRRLPATLPR